MILLKLLFEESPFKTVADIKNFESLDPITLFDTRKAESATNVIALLSSLMKKKMQDRPGIA